MLSELCRSREGVREIAVRVFLLSFADGEAACGRYVRVDVCAYTKGKVK